MKEQTTFKCIHCDELLTEETCGSLFVSYEPGRQDEVTKVLSSKEEYEIAVKTNRIQMMCKMHSSLLDEEIAKFEASSEKVES